MSRSRTFLAFLASLTLAAVSAPLHAQYSRYDGGTFTIELPSGIRTPLALVQRREDPANAFEAYLGTGQHLGMRGLVLVTRTRMLGLPNDRALVDSTMAERMRADTFGAHWRQLRGSRADTSAAARRTLEQMMSDTSVALRRRVLRRAHSLFPRGDATIQLEGEGREIVTEDRVTLRSLATVHLDSGPPLQGIADLTVSRRAGGLLETWVVVYAASRRTPAAEAAAVRMLDSFRVTSTAARAAAPE